MEDKNRCRDTIITIELVTMLVIIVLGVALDHKYPEKSVLEAASDCLADFLLYFIG